MPAVVLAFFTSITVLMLTLFGGNLGERAKRLDADVAAVNVIAYKTALVRYLDTNPSATGVIPDASLTLPTGMKRDATWTNLVADQTLYVYEALPSKRIGLLNTLYLKSQRSVLVGKRQGNFYISAQGATTNAISAAATVIPDGSIVIIGK